MGGGGNPIDQFYKKKMKKGGTVGKKHHDGVAKALRSKLQRGNEHIPFNTMIRTLALPARASATSATSASASRFSAAVDGIIICFQWVLWEECKLWGTPSSRVLVLLIHKISGSLGGKKRLPTKLKPAVLLFEPCLKSRSHHYAVAGNDPP